MIGIYKITNTYNGKVYIGSSRNIKKRIADHFKPSAVSARLKYPLYNDISIYGREKFKVDVIEECEIEDLEELETKYIKSYFGENCYNISKTSHNMKDNEQKNRHGQFFSEWNKKQWSNEEYRAKRSKHSSEVQKQRLLDPDYLKEKSRQLKKYTDSIKKPVGQYDKQGNLIKKFGGTREAERETGIKSSQISAVALNKPRRKTAGGFVWRYL